MHTFPFVIEDPKGHPRTTAAINSQARKALQEGKPVSIYQGKKRVSIIPGISMAAVYYM